MSTIFIYWINFASSYVHWFFFWNKQNIEIIYCIILFFLMGEIAKEDAWRTHVQYLLSQNVSFKLHIFNPTEKLSSELRKQHFFVGAYCVYQFSINSKVSRQFPRGEVWRKISRPWYNLFCVAPFGIEGKTKRRLKARRS